MDSGRRSSDARDEILRRVREALGDDMQATDVPRRYERRLPPAVDLLELFTERVSDYRASVRRVSEAGLAAAIAEALSSRRAFRLAIPADLPAGFLTDASASWLVDDGVGKQALDEVDGVITGCAVAIAETGTIVLDGALGQGRRILSLLPDYHLCIVRQEQIVGSVPEALERLDPKRPQTWISGPSATSDIELQRVEGVHGPRNLEVIVVEAATR